MAKLIYMTNTSLDGFIEDTEGKFDFAFPTPELHQFYNDVARPIGTQIYGRRLYETMAVWETMEFDDEPGEEFAGLEKESADFQSIWIAADKIVYSRTLEKVWTPRTTLRSEFDADAIRALKESSDSDMIIGGAGLAAAAFAAGLIDEIRLTLAPVVIGAGKPAFSPELKLELELLDERRFDNGSVHLHHRVK